MQPKQRRRGSGGFKDSVEPETADFVAADGPVTVASNAPRVPLGYRTDIERDGPQALRVPFEFLAGNPGGDSAYLQTTASLGNEGSSAPSAPGVAPADSVSGASSGAGATGATTPTGRAMGGRGHASPLALIVRAARAVDDFAIFGTENVEVLLEYKWCAFEPSSRSPSSPLFSAYGSAANIWQGLLRTARVCARVAAVCNQRVRAHHLRLPRAALAKPDACGADVALVAPRT